MTTDTKIKPSLHESAAASPAAIPTDQIPDLPSVTKVFISDPKNLLTRSRDDGLLETIDIVTGNVIALSGNPQAASSVYSSTQSIPRDFIELILPTGEKLLVDRSIDMSTISPSFSSNQLSPVLKDKIFEYIASGDSLYSVAKKRKGMPPYSLLLKWYHRYQEFRELVDTARRFRGEYLFDRVMENASRLEDGNMNKAEVDALNAATNFLKWGAEVSDPHNYAHKKDVNPPGVTIIVNTGIDRTDTTIETHAQGVTNEQGE